MNNYNNDFHFSNLERVKAKKLPDGWYWYKYDDGSGCLKAPDNKEYMIYDLSTNEYKETRDSSYSFFPISNYYGDGIEIENFNAFDYMEKEIEKKLIHTKIIDKRLKIMDNLKEYQNISKIVSKNFNYDDFGFYLGIKNIKDDLPLEDIDKLIKICYNNNSAYINSMYLAEELTRAVYIKEYLSLEDLEKIKSDDINNLLYEDKLYLLKNYSSKNNDYQK